MNLIKNLTVITLAAAVGYGCSSSSTPPPTPNGIYSGAEAVTGGRSGANGDEKGIIYNGRMMVFATVFDIQSLIDSQLTITDNSLTGTLNFYGNKFPLSGTAELLATLNDDGSVAGTFTATPTPGTNISDGTLDLTAEPDTFNKGSNLATVAGSWQGTYGGVGDATSLTIDATGTITVGLDDFGCNYTGTVIPADTSINVYNVTIVSTGGTGCTTLPASTYTGLAWTEGVTDSTLNLTVTDGTNSRSIVLTKNG